MTQSKQNTPDLPDEIYIRDAEQRHLGGREGRWTEWIPAEGHITKYVRAAEAVGGDKAGDDR